MLVFAVSGAPRLTPGLDAPGRECLGPTWSSGSFLAIAVNSSLTFSPLLADVSKKSKPASRA
jgi:hypothetical protein